jgi:protein tyrosine/serine phosphatase
MAFNSSNFREINFGKIAPNILYRSSHPICNGRQVEDIILSMNKKNINTIINLSDNNYTLKSKINHCPCYKKIFEDDNVITLNINMKFNPMADKFCEKVKDGLMFMIEHEPPYLIHCQAGIDRTGFFAIILESLMETTFDEIVKDYMLSFVDNNKYSTNDYKEGKIFIMNMFSNIKGNLMEKNENIQYLTEKYLHERIKMNNEELDILRYKLMNVQRQQNIDFC